MINREEIIKKLLFHYIENGKNMSVFDELGEKIYFGDFDDPIKLLNRLRFQFSWMPFYIALEQDYEKYKAMSDVELMSLVLGVKGG